MAWRWRSARWEEGGWAGDLENKLEGVLGLPTSGELKFFTSSLNLKHGGASEYCEGYLDKIASHGGRRVPRKSHYIRLHDESSDGEKLSAMRERKTWGGAVDRNDKKDGVPVKLLKHFFNASEKGKVLALSEEFNPLGA